MPMDSITEDTEHVASALTAPATDDSAELTTVLTGAVELARAAIVEHSGDDVVGEYLGASFDDPTAATHRFLAKLPGYQGWQWAVVVAAHPGADHARSAKWCWCRGRRRCWRRSGCPGTSG